LNWELIAHFTGADVDLTEIEGKKKVRPRLEIWVDVGCLCFQLELEQRRVDTILGTSMVKIQSNLTCNA